MRAGRGQVALGVIATAVLLLFVGRWVAAFLADRWWAEAVDPTAVPFLGRWHLLELALETGGLVVAGAWCVGHFLWVVRSIGAVQVPRRLGDLEIRELLPLGSLRAGAVIAAPLRVIRIPPTTKWQKAAPASAAQTRWLAKPSVASQSGSCTR